MENKVNRKSDVVSVTESEVSVGRHGRWHQICTYPTLIQNPIVMLLFSDEFAISSNRLPYLKFVNRFATITNSIAKF